MDVSQETLSTDQEEQGGDSEENADSAEPYLHGDDETYAETHLGSKLEIATSPTDVTGAGPKG